MHGARGWRREAGAALGGAGPSVRDVWEEHGGKLCPPRPALAAALARLLERVYPWKPLVAWQCDGSGGCLQGEQSTGLAPPPPACAEWDGATHSTR